MILIVEFPMNIICAYNGASNIDVTLDDNISYLLGKHFYDSKIDFAILKVEDIIASPNINDELLRYTLEIGISFEQFEVESIAKELRIEGFDKGLFVKSEGGEILYGDMYSADIPYGRQLKGYS